MFMYWNNFLKHKFVCCKKWAPRWVVRSELKRGTKWQEEKGVMVGVDSIWEVGEDKCRAVLCLSVRLCWQPRELNDHSCKRLLWGLWLLEVEKLTGSKEARAQREWKRYLQQRICSASASNCTSLSHIDLISSCFAVCAQGYGMPSNKRCQTCICSPCMEACSIKPVWRHLATSL